MQVVIILVLSVTDCALLITTRPYTLQIAVAWKVEELVCHRSSYYGLKVSKEKLGWDKILFSFQ